MRDLRGKTAVIIGAGSGIGRGIARAAAVHGMSVAVADIDGASAADAASELAAAGSNAFAFETDATDPAALAALRSNVQARFGSIDLLSNNAGVTYQCGLVDASPDDWRWVMEFNLYTAVNACSVFVPAMREQGGGHVLNNASLAGLAVFPGLGIGLYTTSKFALVAYSEMLRSEIAGDGIGVSVLCPSMTRSNLAQTSSRNRPARYGGPLDSPCGGMPDVPDEQMMSPDEVGRIGLEGVRENRLFILTHPELVGVVEQRFDAIALDCSGPAGKRG